MAVLAGLSHVIPKPRCAGWRTNLPTPGDREDLLAISRSGAVVHPSLRREETYRPGRPGRPAGDFEVGGSSPPLLVQGRKGCTPRGVADPRPADEGAAGQ